MEFVIKLNESRKYPMPWRAHMKEGPNEKEDGEGGPLGLGTILYT